MLDALLYGFTGFNLTRYVQSERQQIGMGTQSVLDILRSTGGSNYTITFSQGLLGDQGTESS
ncbi:hypothetical protein D3C76_1507600 [compost metagenome]